ncbi:MAG: cell division protein FtsA [Deltaproteobacteria bacterium]|nr:MAG: cell division protein FtsA [Deltaproteobacteria bacterium]
MEDFRRNRLITGIDVRSNKLLIMVSEMQSSGKLSVIYIGSHLSKGFESGIIIDMHQASVAVLEMLEVAEKAIGSAIDHVCIGIMGSHIWGINGQMDVQLKNRRFSKRDLIEIINIIKKNIYCNDRYEVLHIFPQEFILDGCKGIKNPIGMYMRYCQLKSYVITGSQSVIKNMLKCFKIGNVKIVNIVSSALVTANSLLTCLEKEIGAIYLDIEEEFSSLVVFKNGAILHFVTIPVGGMDISRDIIFKDQSAQNEAEYLKKIFCCSNYDESYQKMMSIISSNQVKFMGLKEELIKPIIISRIEEIVQIVMQEIIQIGLYDILPGGIVLTGKWALCSEIRCLISKMTGFSVRIGKPHWDNDILNDFGGPIYSSLIGIQEFCAKEFLVKNK